MGVTDLWQVLSPVKQDVALSKLSGQVIAIDLSIWICDSQHLQHVQPKPHLRNIFWRLVKLIGLGIRPVFVVDGTPPDVKYDTIRKRCNIINQASSPSMGSVQRTQFNFLVKECCRMLDILGVPYLQSVGEAEALCALLNAEKVVDACVTNDGDAFLYGAKTVYKNFTIDNKDPHVESYSMTDIESQLSLSREHLVALALLVGCDYMPAGVPKVGRVQAIKLLKILKCDHILDRFKSWNSDTDLEKDDVEKPTHCKICTHTGGRREHLGTGCTICNRDKSCDKDSTVQCTCTWHQLQHSGRACEVDVWKKAKLVQGFPNQKVIDEFLITQDTLPEHPLVWKQPNVLEFATFADETLHWPHSTTIDKTIPWLTVMNLRSLRDGITDGDTIQPYSIVKTRIQKGVDCLEIQWHKLADDKITQQPYYVTVENRELFSQCYPEMVKNFVQAQSKQKSKATDGSDGSEQLTRGKTKGKNSSKSPTKRRKLEVDSGQQKPITSFFQVKKSASKSASSKSNL